MVGMLKEVWMAWPQGKLRNWIVWTKVVAYMGVDIERCRTSVSRLAELRSRKESSIYFPDKCVSEALTTIVLDDIGI